MHNKKLSYVFGPVASRRLGLSLGIDLLLPKTCTLDCVYCESGKTTLKTLLRKEWVPTRAVIEELDGVLASDPLLDFITFSGSGEPTLHSGIGEIIEHIISKWPEYKLCVLTNGTLLWQQEVREDIKKADRVIASYDAASSEVFEKINRPYPGLFSDRILEGLIAFREVFSGEFWIEIFVVPGLNTKKREVDAIAEDISLIKPDKVQLNTLDRPGAESWVKVAGEELLELFRNRIKDVEFISYDKGEKAVVFTDDKSLEAKIESMVLRRPITLEDLVQTQGVSRAKAEQVLSGMHLAGRLGIQRMDRGVFYVHPNAFPLS